MAQQGEIPRRGPRAFLADLVLRGLFGLALALPYGPRVRLVGWSAAHLVAPLAGWRGRIRANLAHVLPDLPGAEVRRLTRAVPDNAGRALAEIWSGAGFVARVRDLHPTGPGLAVLQASRAAGRPVVLVTGHFGNYDAPRAWLAANGYPVGGLYNPMRNGYFNARYVAAISAIARPVFPRGRAGLAGMVRFLRGGGMLGLVIDQFMSRGVLLDFLGRPAPTALSAAELALRHDAALVPIYGIRQPDGLGFEIRIEAPIPPGPPEAMTQALNDSLAALVRQYPEQWFWVHRRWKPERHARIRARQEGEGG